MLFYLANGAVESFEIEGFEGLHHIGQAINAGQVTLDPEGGKILISYRISFQSAWSWGPSRSSGKPVSHNRDIGYPELTPVHNCSDFMFVRDLKIHSQALIKIIFFCYKNCTVGRPILVYSQIPILHRAPYLRRWVPSKSKSVSLRICYVLKWLKVSSEV